VRIASALGAAQAEHSESLDPVPWQLVGSHQRMDHSDVPIPARELALSVGRHARTR
jgi:hypothetical protein